MPTAGFSPPQGNQSTAQLQDWIIKLCRDLEYYMNNLDTVNISRLDARVIIAQSITALQIAANSITANEIAANAITTSELAAGAVTADKITVTELSAITANLGTITAGIIYGAYIATANGSYPRIEFSSAGNLLSAFTDATHSLNIVPIVSGNPAIRFDSPSGFSYLAKTLTKLILISEVIVSVSGIDGVEIDSSDGDVRILSNDKVEIIAPGGLWVNGVLVAI